MLFFNILLEILDISTRYRAVKYTKTQNIPQISTFYLSCYVIFKKPTTRSRRGGITSCHRSALQLSCHFHVPNIIYDFPPQPSTVNSINLWVGGGGVWFIGLWARVSTSSFVSQIFAASSLHDGIILFFTIAERAQTHKHTHVEKSPQPSVIYESIEDIRGQICWIRLLSPAWTLSSVHSAFESQSCHFLSDSAAP